uniref:FYVE-type domain-containing protein n=1 Tax=Globisporangium ultimum (strain ATCC 200006 / CBS 805.95 / DAOM BR144) TaxID=431595 RepID=K3W691_GLOUD
MNSKTKFTSPFPPLQLSENDGERLDQLAHLFMCKNIAQYEAFLEQRDGQQHHIDDHAWKLVKQRERIRVYSERTKNLNYGEDTTSRYTDSDSSSSATKTAPPLNRSNSNAVSSAATPDLPVMLVVGAVEGTLDDMMYGVVNHTLEDMRVKSAYVRDNVGDGAVLATLATPTHENPFQSFTIKWMENEQMHVLRPMVRNRDFVYMESTGITNLSSGERIGFHLLHSVHFPQTHELASRVRGNLSICGIYRQIPGTNDVDVHITGILNPGGNLMRAVVVKAAADALVSVWKNVECAHMKKLTWLLRTMRRSFSNASDTSSGKSGSEVGCCTTCKKAPSSFAVSVLGDLRKRKCNLCWKYVCSSCRIKKTLSHVNAPSGRLRQREFPFCGACIKEATTSNAFMVAQREFASVDLLSDLFATNQSEQILSMDGGSHSSSNPLAESMITNETGAFSS